MTGFFDTRFIINTGKGGAGKTTVSAAMACAYAAQGKRALLMQLNATDRVGKLFGVQPIGPDITSIAPNLCAVNTTPADSLREYALMVVKVRAIYRAVFENRVASKLLRVMPGLPELTMLGKAYYHEKEIESGAPRWDVVIIDAPATGHGMFLLQIPQVVTSALGSGRMADESRRMVDLLEDHKRTCINLITLPEEMPVNETIELQSRLQAEFDIRVGAVFANGVLPRQLDEADEETIRALLTTHGTEADDLGSLLSAALFRARRCDLQERYLRKLRRELDAPIVELPFYFDPVIDRAVLDRMAAELIEGVA
jgi:anion-transporting  ArsA/GET3 family ATPase